MPRHVSSILAILVLSAAALAQPKVSVTPAPFDAAMSRLAVDDAGTVHLVFRRQREANLHYTRKASADSSFSEPIVVNTIPDSVGSFAIGVSRRGTPHVFFTASGRYIRQQIGERQLTPRDIKYMFYSRLDDDGDFSPQVDVAGPTWGFEFTGTIGVQGENDVVLLWQGTTNGGGEAEREVYRVVSTDAGRTFSDVQTAFTGKGACVCCFMDAHVDRDGTLLLAYRAAVDGLERDTYLLTSSDMGAHFEARNIDPWHATMCPASSYDFAEHNRTWVAWETEGRVFCGTIDNGQIQRKIAAGPTPTPHKRPTIAVNAKGQVLLAWSQVNELIRWQIFNQDGEPLLDVPGSAQPHNRRWPAPAAYADAQGDFVIVY